MRFGLRIPHTGAAASGPEIMRFVQRAGALGFASVWAGDHIVLPSGGPTPRPRPR
jgi:alkanesulfonate monooxygenase SsuD/methylene tetrahydromethanopterin reductase-like flavin-dependent oxidoreductase (luciferase family)